MTNLIDTHPVLLIAKRVLEYHLPSAECHVDGHLLFVGIEDEENGEGHQCIVEHRPKHNAVLLGIKPDIILPPSKIWPRYFHRLERQLELFLVDRYARPGSIELYKFPQAVALAYEVGILYDRLDNEELTEELTHAFIRTVRAMAMLAPVFNEMLVRGGTIEPLHSLELFKAQHNRLEIESFTNVDNHRVCLPSGLSGGLGELLSQ